MENDLLRRLKPIDDRRPGFPGEHWLALGAGVLLLTRRSDSVLARVASVALGTALVVRAASGRDRLARSLLSPRLLSRFIDRRRGPRSHPRFLDIAAPWPYQKRVRVSAISQPVGKTMWTP